MDEWAASLKSTSHTDRSIYRRRTGRQGHVGQARRLAVAARWTLNVAEYSGWREWHWPALPDLVWSVTRVREGPPRPSLA